MIRTARILAVLAIPALLASISVAQPAVRLVGRAGSEVEMAYAKRSVIFDLNKVLTGANGSLPSAAPHRYRVLFTAEKDGAIYVVANVRSGSPVTTPLAACAGDSPESLLWIKTDKTLQRREARSEIYLSCLYNYRNSKVKHGRTGITFLMGDGRRVELRYDNDHPEKGLVISKSFN